MKMKWSEDIDQGLCGQIITVKIPALSFAKGCGFELVTKSFEPQVSHLGRVIFTPQEEEED